MTNILAVENNNILKIPKIRKFDNLSGIFLFLHPKLELKDEH